MVTSQEKAERFAHAAPKLNQKELAKINELFPAYIFRRHKTGEVWCSCCQHHGQLGDSLKERYIWQAEHQREARNMYDHPPRAEETCPYCGRPVIVKEFGRTGNRDNLCAYRRAMVFRWYRGALWATAYDCKKLYATHYELTKLPDCKLVGVFRFKPGKAEGVSRYYYADAFTGITTQTGPLHKRWRLCSPFPSNEFYGNSYDVVGGEEILKSPFRYAVAALKSPGRQEYYKSIELMTACCFYAPKIEMLAKCGLQEVVQNLVNRAVKHARVINWEATDPKKVLKISRKEWKDFLATGSDIGTAELYTLLHGKASMADCAEWNNQRLNYYAAKADANTWGVHVLRLIHYLDDQTKLCHLASITQAQSTWRDYVSAARWVQYPLHRDNVLLPPDLASAHDEATEAHRRQLQSERDKAEAQRIRQKEAAYAKRKEDLEEKYGYEDAGIMIRIPGGSEEIVQEGVALKHCVAGYAERHIEGSTTILFMRHAEAPETPWLTIEMYGNKIIQIHGFRNEGLFTGKGRFAPDPREVHRGWLDRWLAWLKKGSPRNQDGTPKLPTHRKKTAA